MRLLFDCETNGLLAELDRLHSLVLQDADKGTVWSCADHTGYIPIRDGLKRLQDADQIIGHNVLDFDCRAIEKVYPDVRLDRDRVHDTLLYTRILWPEVKKGDFLRVKRGTFPSNLLMRPHSLAAWGYRLGVFKGEFGKTTDWQEWTAEMQSYCEQDVTVTAALWKRIESKKLDPRVMKLEREVALVCAEMTANGFPFDRKAAGDLYARILTDKDALAKQLQQSFPPIERRSVFVPKANNSKLGYRKGVPIEKVQVEEFNPSSRAMIAERLKDRYGWKPEKFTKEGAPQVDETVLEGLDYPEAALLNDYLLVEKRAGQVAEGKQGWLKAERNGLIHCEYATLGTVTGRAAHKNPNLGQVTKHCDRYGNVFRALFTSGRFPHLVGVDMSGLELRCLAHYLAPFDDGRYVHLVTEGDVHTANMQAAGLMSRDQAKTFIYAFLYGAGDEKLGHIVNPLLPAPEKVRIGKALKASFLAKTPGLKDMRKAIKQAAEARDGFLVGLDGRPLTIRKEHAAVNTLLQSAGAILCKQWMVSSVQKLRGRGLSLGWDGDFVLVAWVHDELQFAARTPEIADIIKEVAIQETTLAGEFFKLRCPLAGEGKKGRTWAETH